MSRISIRNGLSKRFRQLNSSVLKVKLISSLEGEKDYRFRDSGRIEQTKIAILDDSSLNVKVYFIIYHKILLFTIAISEKNILVDFFHDFRKKYNAILMTFSI